MLNIIRTHLRARLTLAFALVLLIPTIVIAAYSTHSTSDSLIRKGQEDSLSETELVGRGLIESLSRVKWDVQFMSHFDDIPMYLNAVAAHQNNVAQDKLGSIQAMMLTYLQVNPNYGELRFADSTGQLIVEVKRLQGQEAVVPASGLGNIADQDYFQKAKQLSSNKVYYARPRSDTDDKPQTTPEPVLHVATPIHTSNDQFAGV